MNEAKVIELMESSQTEAEWKANCDQVKAACGGDYPPFWWSAMKLSGRTESILARWGSTSALQITYL